jgi:hypothetical protein
MLKFDARGNVNDLGRDAGRKGIEMAIERFESLQVLIAARD